MLFLVHNQGCATHKKTPLAFSVSLLVFECGNQSVLWERSIKMKCFLDLILLPGRWGPELYTLSDGHYSLC